MAAPLDIGIVQFCDSSGKPLAGGTVDLYIPNTTSRKNTWTNADEAEGHLNANPITLDAGGRATIFGEGLYECVVKDSSGVQILDAMGSAWTVSTAMGPVLAANTLFDAFSALGAAGGNIIGNFGVSGILNVSGPIASGALFQAPSIIVPTAGQLNVVLPVGSPLATRNSFSVAGQTQYPSNREFLGAFSLTSNSGNGFTSADKAALFVGVEGQYGTGNALGLWVVGTADAGSGNYPLQGIQVTVNNNAYWRGSGTLTTDYNVVNNPVYGVQITGSGLYTCTAGLMVGGACTGMSPAAQWDRGVVVTGICRDAAFSDWSTSPVGMQFDGSYSLGAINLTETAGNSGAAGTVAMRMKNSQVLAWQTIAKTDLIFDYVDPSNNRIIAQDGAGGGVCAGVAMGALTFPLHAGAGLGKPDLPWGDTYISNTRAGGDIFPYPNNTRSLGTPDWYWVTVYLQNGPQIESDVASKNDITDLPDVRHLIKNIDPIQFKWKETDGGRPGKRMHWGFDAEKVGAAFNDLGHDFAGYVEHENGRKGLRPTELIPVLWKGLQDVWKIVEELQAQKESKKDE